MSEYRRRCASIAVTLLIINLLVSAIPEALSISFAHLSPVVSTDDNWTSPHRKLLHSEGAAVEQMKRVWGDTCSTADIVINQAQTAPLPSGIPSYSVEITNVCATGCDIAGIHLNCVWFSSARLINPRIFKRLKYNDCLVNDGKPLGNGRTLSFQYYNTFQYPLSVQRVNC